MKMRFRDLLPASEPKQVGRVVSAAWDEARHGIGFRVQFDPSGRILDGFLRAGVDPVTGNFVSETDLRAKLSALQGLGIYENATGCNPNTLSSEDFRKLKIEFSLSNLRFSYRPPDRPLETNTFLSRILR
jgi:hypothetical protein